MNCLRLALYTLPDSHIIIRSRQHTDIFGCLSRHHLLLHYLELLLKLLALQHTLILSSRFHFIYDFELLMTVWLKTSIISSSCGI